VPIVGAMPGASELEIRWASRAGGDLAGALQLRERVFCGEQGVPYAEERDGRDGSALHLVALAPQAQREGDGRVVATLRLLLDREVAKIGRVAVRRDWRRRGIASRMLRIALDQARARGCTSVRLAAQVDATGLYERAGFSVSSEPFEEAGILHVGMGLELPPRG
jgi:predicted GNAT family N-acyltransferase